MKKLMIAAAIVCAAAFAQAAAVDWQMTVSGAKSSYAGKYDALAGGNLYTYVFSAATWSGLESVTKDSFNLAIDSSGFVQNGSKPAGATYQTGVGTDTIVPGVKVISNDGWGIGDPVSLMYVLVDKSADTWTYTAMAVTPTARDPQAGNNHTGEFSKTLTEINGMTWKNVSSGDVPEPTSAMLLLLGMAGLALRRRQA